MGESILNWATHTGAIAEIVASLLLASAISGAETDNGDQCGADNAAPNSGLCPCRDFDSHNKIPFNQAVKSIFRGSVRSKENIDDVILQLIYFLIFKSKVDFLKGIDFIF